MKTLQSLAHEYDIKWHMWLDIANDPEELHDRDKTKEQAMYLANYFEGRYDGVHDALNLRVRL